METNEALDIVKNMYDNANGDEKKALENLIDGISEHGEPKSDEKMINAIMAYFKRNPYAQIDCNDYIGSRDVISWCEGQLERMKDDRYNALEMLIKAYDIHQVSVNETMTNEACSMAIDAISKIGVSELLDVKQRKSKHQSAVQSAVKSAAETSHTRERKFKPGDWIVDTHGYVSLVIGMDDESYQTVDSAKYMHTFSHDAAHENFHVWTVQDIQSNDVLYAKDMYGKEWLMLVDYPFHGINKNDEYVELLYEASYCISDNKFYENPNSKIWDGIELYDVICPANNKQYDLLLQKFDEYDFVYDADELKNRRSPVNI